MTQSHIVTLTDSVRVHVTDNGVSDASRTFLLLHYFGGSAASWGDVANAMHADVRLILPDMRGFGGSAAQNGDVTYTMDDMADDVTAIAAYFDLADYTLVGHSMGGKVAVAVAARNPPGLRDVVLLAPSPPTPEPMTDDARQTFLENHHNRDATLATIRKITGKPLTPEQMAQFVADQEQMSDAAWAAWIQHGSREDLSERAAKVRMPVRILSGDADGAIALDVVRREVAERLNAPHTVLPNIGHLLNYEATEDVARFLMM